MRDDVGMTADPVSIAPLANLGHHARTAAQTLTITPTAAKAAALRSAAASIREDADAILAANAQDIVAAEANGLSGAMLDRLRLDRESRRWRRCPIRSAT